MLSRSVAHCVLLLLGALGCAPPAAPSSARTAAAGGDAPLSDAALAQWLRPAPPRNEARGSAREADAAAELARLLPLVAQRRGLDAGEPPGLDSVDRAELVERALAWLAQQTPAAQREARDELLQRLELVPDGFSLTSALRDLLERELKAFYDPASRRIVIDRALPASVRRRVLAHELVHALVDRHHHLGARLSALDSSDRRDALLTLAEGDADAVVAELDQVARVAPDAAERSGAERSAIEPAAAESLPGVLARSLEASYLDGRAAVRRLLDSGGFAAVDALYRQPPAGTHQLLAESFPRTTPPPVPPLPAPAPPEPGWTLLHADVLGAQTWRSVLEEWLPAERAAELARGWDGDRLVWFERGTERVLVWEVRTNAAEVAEVAAVVSRALRLAPTAPDNRTPGASTRATRLACRAQRDGIVMGRWFGARSLSIASLTGPAQSVQCARLSAWMIPATRR